MESFRFVSLLPRYERFVFILKVRLLDNNIVIVFNGRFIFIVFVFSSVHKVGELSGYFVPACWVGQAG